MLCTVKNNIICYYNYTPILDTFIELTYFTCFIEIYFWRVEWSDPGNYILYKICIYFLLSTEILPIYTGKLFALRKYSADSLNHSLTFSLSSCSCRLSCPGCRGQGWAHRWRGLSPRPPAQSSPGLSAWRWEPAAWWSCPAARSSCCNGMSRCFSSSCGW